MSTTFNLVLVNPAKGLSSTIFVEGYPVDVPVSLPEEIDSYEWVGNDLHCTCSFKSDQGRGAWGHTKEYLRQLLAPESIIEPKIDKVVWYQTTLFEQMLTTLYSWAEEGRTGAYAAYEEFIFGGYNSSNHIHVEVKLVAKQTVALIESLMDWNV